ncbi:hypothetical protein JQ581_08510 [Bradyrhizobium liaoningense]|nr:hypothetical protein [Bradyrhizobium liaoningense]
MNADDWVLQRLESLRVIFPHSGEGRLQIGFRPNDAHVDCVHTGMLSAISIRTSGTCISDAIEHVAKRGCCLVGRYAFGRMESGDIDRPTAGVRVGPVLGPAVLLAFVDGACLLQHMNRPSA